MGWLSRTFKPADAGSDPAHHSAPEEPPVPPVPAAGDGTATLPVTPSVQPPTTSAPQSGSGPSGASGASGASTPTGRYGPLVSVTRFEVAPPELEWQLPLNGELYRLMPGSDRPDYSLFVLERPLHFYPAADFDLGRVEAQQRVQDRKGRTMVRVHAMLLCARFVGQQLHPGMKDLAVNLAYVIDNSLARDPEVDFSKIQFAAIGFLSEGHSIRPEAEPVGTDSEQDALHDVEQSAGQDGALSAEAAPTRGEATADPAGRHTSSDVSDVLDELARTLRDGVEAERGAHVERLTAVLTVGPDHRLTGLSGNADGQAPIPTADTFDRLGEILARLSALGQEGRVATVTVRADGDVVTHEVTAAHD